MKSIFFCAAVTALFISCNGAGTDQASTRDSTGASISIDTTRRDPGNRSPYMPTDSGTIKRDTSMRQ